jgi:predicted transcriptional regulator of viral defense system
MGEVINYRRLDDWLEKHQSKGKLAFSLKELRQSFKDDSAFALKQVLERISKRGKILSIHKGYYLIIPPQYSSKGILPPAMFVDGLMKFLGRRYYVALLNAAAMHGASHQQPQEYFIITGYPILRTTFKKGIKINYISTRQLPPETLLEKRKTETGYMTISNPLLTAIDLITYEKRIGGLNRAATVISELVEHINLRMVNQEIINYATVSSLQRLGYILEEILDEKLLANKIWELSKKAGDKFYLIPLKSSTKKSNSEVNKKWNLIINAQIETDF